MDIPAPSEPLLTLPTYYSESILNPRPAAVHYIDALFCVSEDDLKGWDGVLTAAF